MAVGRNYPDQINERHAWIFPKAPDAEDPLHPLISWWAVLFILSMLSRYQPNQWIAELNVDSSANAVPIEHILEAALSVCPNLIVDAIASV